MIHIFGEEHDFQGKNYLELLELKKNHMKNPVSCLSFEHEDTVAENILTKYAKRNNIEIAFNDIRKGLEREDELESRIENFTLKEIDEYRSVSRENMQRRNTYISDKLCSYKGDVIHIGGAAHLYDLKSIGKVTWFAAKKKTTEVEGDVLDSAAQMLAHGVAEDEIENMGTGIAKQINQRWPETFGRFKKLRKSRKFKLGDVIIDYENNPRIAYIATQKNLQNAEESAINSGMRNLRKEIEKNYITSCAIPKIGCGYGKLNWGKVEQILSNQLNGSKSQFLIYTENHHYKDR